MDMHEDLIVMDTLSNFPVARAVNCSCIEFVRDTIFPSILHGLNCN